MSNENQPFTYDIRKDDAGWTVFKMATGEPAHVNGVPQTGLEIEAADDLCDMLEAFERHKACSAIH